MKVLVAGIRSALGSRVADLLRAQGHTVAGLSRAPGPDLIVADLLDPLATKHAVALAAPDAIVQTVNALPKAGPRKAQDMTATNRLRIEGTRNLLAAAGAVGVERYVAEAFVFGYDVVPAGAPPITEEARFGESANESSRALGVLDHEVRAYGGITVRCGLFYGPRLGSTDAQAAMIRRGRLPTIRGAQNLLPYVHIDDAAAAVVAALHRGRNGEAYNAVAEAEAPAAFISAVAGAVGGPRPRAVPRWLFRALAGGYATAFFTAHLPVSNTRARSELGWTPAYPTAAEGAATLVNPSPPRPT